MIKPVCHLQAHWVIILFVSPPITSIVLRSLLVILYYVYNPPPANRNALFYMDTIKYI